MFCIIVQVHLQYSYSVESKGTLYPKQTRIKGMVDFGQPTRKILAIAKDLGVPPASFNHIIDTKSLGHLEHASHPLPVECGAECLPIKAP